MPFGQLGFDHFRVSVVLDGGSGGYGGSVGEVKVVVVLAFLSGKLLGTL